MHPILFIFPDGVPLVAGRPVYAYGIFFGFALVAGFMLTSRAARKAGIAPNVVTWALVLTCVGGILGARALFLATNPDLWQGPMSLLRLDTGGLVAYGGFVGGALLSALYVRLVARQPFLPLADHAAAPLALGLGLTRIGCWLFGCDYGTVTTGPLGVRFPMWSGELALSMGQHGSPAFFEQFEGQVGQVTDHVTRQVGQVEASLHAARGTDSMGLWREAAVAFEAKLQALGGLVMGGQSAPVVPTQLIESAAGFLGFGALLWLHRRRRFPGQVFLAAALGYAIFRFVIEFWRGDGQRGTVGPLSTSQAIGVGIGVLALAFWYRQRRQPLNREGTGAHAGSLKDASR